MAKRLKIERLISEFRRKGRGPQEVLFSRIYGGPASPTGQMYYQFMWYRNLLTIVTSRLRNDIIWLSEKVIRKRPDRCSQKS